MFSFCWKIYGCHASDVLQIFLNEFSGFIPPESVSKIIFTEIEQMLDSTT